MAEAALDLEDEGEVSVEVRFKGPSWKKVLAAMDASFEEVPVLQAAVSAAVAQEGAVKYAAITVPPTSVAVAPDPFPPSDDVGTEPEPATVVELGYSKADVRQRCDAILAKLGNTDGVKVIQKLFAKFGAKSLPQLKSEHYAEFMADSEGLLS